MTTETPLQHSFFKHHKLPVFQHLSQSSVLALSHYLETGNTQHRHKQLLEFFKSLDWLSLNEVKNLPNTPLKKLTGYDQKQLTADIKAYFDDKAQKQTEKRSQRHDYQLRIFAYFKQKISSQDKTMLERLRDYELDRTGKDDNFQHYFKLGSFKKIDEFVNLTHIEKMARIDAFKKDVALYEQNLKKLRQQAEGYYQTFNFDDWCDANPDNSYQKTQQQTNQKQQQRSSNNHHTAAEKGKMTVPKALTLLEVSSSDTLEDVKRQFRKMTLQHHPDLPTGNLQKMQTLNLAYQCLKKHFNH